MLDCLLATTATALVKKDIRITSLQCMHFDALGMHLFRVSKFSTMSAMKRPMSPKMPPLAPTTTVQWLSKQALKKLPAGRSQQNWPALLTQDTCILCSSS